MKKTKLPRNDILTKEQILHVAGLANLQVSNQELELYTKQLQEILGYVEQLNQVETSGVKPTYQTIDGTVNGWREDEVRSSLTQAEALSGAKRTAEGCFVTASVFEFNKARPSVTKAGPFPARSHRDKYNAILTEIFNEETPRLGGESPLIGHKDLFLTKGIETTAGSRVLEGFMPQYSASVVDKLKKAGYRAKYKFNCDAWAHGSSGENSAFGATKNPWNLDYVPGGSSSGSAAAVAAGLVDFATGTDTGGSIRLPASFCGVTGLKPTYGAVSRYGIVAMSSSLDSPGIIGKSVKEVEKAFKVMAGEDNRDPTSRNGVKRPGLRLQRPGLGRRRRMKIGLPKEYLAEGVDGEVKKAVM
ncbi:MAG: Glutamyl-tRNA(Gln) amidotransferase subunit A, partial [Candidatus Gottesmanbacteria bacterium GW2011_GWA2_44_17]